MPFGAPVVPEENRMNSGCANGRRSKRGGGACTATIRSKLSACLTPPWPMNENATTCSTDGSPARISATRSASECVLPPYQ